MYIWLDFDGKLVGKYTSPMDPMRYKMVVGGRMVWQKSPTDPWYMGPQTRKNHLFMIWKSSTIFVFWGTCLDVPGS